MKQSKKEMFSIDVREIDWTRVDAYFKGYTHIDVAEIEEAYEDYVIPMRNVMMEEAKVSIKYKLVDVISREKDQIVMEGGIAFSGKLIAKAYEKAEKIILYLASVLNMDQLMEKYSDPMETFFLDYWAVSLLNAIREKYCDLFAEKYVDEHSQLTYVWSPGQSKFALENQVPLFQLLQPEEMGVTLDRYHRMVPFKSVSGTVGIVSKEVKDLLCSCDLCDFAKSCPGYKGKKYAGIPMEQRYL